MQPLRVVDIALATGNRSGVARVGNDDLDATILQEFEHSHPVHPGGLHGGGLDTDRHEPVRHPLDIAGERLEGLYCVSAQIWWYPHHMEPGANVDTSSTVMNDR